MYFVNPPCMKQGCNQKYYTNNTTLHQNEFSENAMPNNSPYMNMQYPSPNYDYPVFNSNYPTGYPVAQNDMTDSMPMSMPMPMPMPGSPGSYPETMPAPPSTDSPPETVTDIYFTPGFLKTQIGRTMRVEFLMGTNAPLVDRIGVLLAVGASYILLQPIETQQMIMCDIYSIKFVTIIK